MKKMKVIGFLTIFFVFGQSYAVWPSWLPFFGKKQEEKPKVQIKHIKGQKGPLVRGIAPAKYNSISKRSPLLKAVQEYSKRTIKDLLNQIASEKDKKRRDELQEALKEKISAWTDEMIENKLEKIDKRYNALQKGQRLSRKDTILNAALLTEQDQREEEKRNRPGSELPIKELLTQLAEFPLSITGLSEKGKKRYYELQEALKEKVSALSDETIKNELAKIEESFYALKKKGRKLSKKDIILNAALLTEQEQREQ